LAIATEVGSEPKKTGPATPRISEIYSWASQLASESRKQDWIFYWYVWPDAVREIIHKLKTMNGGIIGLVGAQGVGKSSALLAILAGRMLFQNKEYRKKHKSGKDPNLGKDIIRFKWRRYSELIPSLLKGTHELLKAFRYSYSATLIAHLENSLRLPIIYRSQLAEVKKNPATLNLDWAEKTIGRSQANRLREQVWLQLVLAVKLVLIDTPDYAKTDRRLMTKDLEEIYWLWNWICQAANSEDQTRPNIVVAIQKEMFHGHFFLDKMDKVELEPLRPEQMVEAYRKRFKSVDPFTDDALLNLARMSRGIFRRFLRYITLTLSHWERNGKGAIDIATVKEAVTVERLAEDMELELVELFPKHSDLRFLAVRLLMLLEESGERKQSELATLLEVEPYMLSRLLTKLEAARYVSRRREGNDKIVSLCTPRNQAGEATVAV
jgi:hypothetical protein